MARNGLRDKLRQRQNGRCCYCLVSLTPTYKPAKKSRPLPTAETIEHLHRVFDGGSNKHDNIALACYRCNSERGGIDWLTYTSYRRGEFWEAA